MTEARQICFIANDRRFFFRHFRPAIEAAAACGYERVACLPDGEDDDCLPAPGVEIVGSPITRAPLTIAGLYRQAAWLLKQFRKQRPNIVMAFSVRPALALALVLPWIKLDRAIIYVTGLGLLELLPDRKSRILRALTYWMLRRAARRDNCYFIFENRVDPLNMGFGPGEPRRQALLIGAGVDEDEFAPSAMPPLEPLRLASVSRLVWSKGIDLAVAAVAELAREGHPIRLNIYGTPDSSNPRAVDPSLWASQPGVTVHGHTDDIPAIWRDNHVGIFPSRGGEGVPRSLIEAAACGRPSIVTDVPGCRDFVRHGIDGFVIESESVPAIKNAIMELLARRSSLKDFGAAARERFLATGTSRIIQAQHQKLFDLSRRDATPDGRLLLKDCVQD